jgi:hypothetical protein
MIDSAGTRNPGARQYKARLLMLALSALLSMGVSRCERIIIGDACQTRSGDARIDCCKAARAAIGRGSSGDAACEESVSGCDQVAADAGDSGAIGSDAGLPADGACQRGGCFYKGKHYRTEETFRDLDECSNCTCNPGGTVGCASLPPGSCDEGCTYEGKHYRTKESFRDAEDCADCTCNLGGAVGCAVLPPGSCGAADGGTPAAWNNQLADCCAGQ